MRYIWQHIHTIIDTYNGSIPLAHFLKNHFKASPKLGSRDRRILSEMAYSWYRCAKGINAPGITFEEKVQACLFLCSTQPRHIAPFIPESWGFTPDMPLTARMDILQQHSIPFDLNNLFPHNIELSAGIEKEAWLQSTLAQPQLFLRIRKDKDRVVKLLNENSIPFEFVTSNCISLPNGAPIDKLLPPDAYVVQDASSQQTGTCFHPHKNERWYDCCSGAGGKSLLLTDMQPAVQLTISDKRESIISNLKQRFKQYHYASPATHVIDVADREQLKKVLGTKQFDNIICDVPCSGSGTWARTPEQLYFFDPSNLSSFTDLQKTIAVNVSSYLKEGGALIYITCSIFKEENEAAVKHIIETTGMHLQESKIINGIKIQADSMFVAVLRKPE